MAFFFAFGPWWFVLPLTILVIVVSVVSSRKQNNRRQIQYTKPTPESTTDIKMLGQTSMPIRPLSPQSNSQYKMKTRTNSGNGYKVLGIFLIIFGLLFLPGTLELINTGKTGGAVIGVFITGILLLGGYGAIRKLV
jgi:hypothetical protein